MANASPSHASDGKGSSKLLNGSVYKTAAPKTASIESEHHTNGVKSDSYTSTSHDRTKGSTKDVSYSNVAPPQDSPHKSFAKPSATTPSREPSHSSPSRSPRRSSRDTTTPSTLRAHANSASKSSPRRSPFCREETHSPSRQLHEEFARFQIDSQAAFAARLDRQSEQLAQRHAEALAEAATKHEAVLQSAQIAKEKLELQLENDTIRRRLQEADEVERIRREKSALEEAEQQRKLDAAKELEKEAQRRRDKARETAEAEDRARKEAERLVAESQQRQESAERARVEQETARERQQQEQEKAKQQEALTSTPIAPTPVVATPTSAPITQSDEQPLMQWAALENIHNRYLDLHGKLKTMRKDVMAAYKQAKGNPRSKVAQIADMRRSLAKLLGQFTSDKAKNKAIRNQVEQIMVTAWNTTDIALDAKLFVLSPSHTWPTGERCQVSGVFIYLVNILTKLAFESMGAASRQTAYNAVDYYGVVLSWIVSNSKFRLHGNSFADVIIAKFHASCPPLFGVYGPENTARGRKRLGWHEEDNSQEHFDKVNALAIGWGALTLRDYTRLAGENSAIPAWHYWQSLACIVNVPLAELTKTHGILLKGLIDQYAHLFIKFYGQAAIVVLRRALVQLPDEVPEAAGFDKVKVVRDNLYIRLQLQL